MFLGEDGIEDDDNTIKGIMKFIKNALSVGGGNYE